MLASSGIGIGFRHGLQFVAIPRIAEPPVFGTTVVEPDLLADLRQALHVGAARRTFVQLFPPAGAGSGCRIGHDYFDAIEYLMRTPSTNSVVMS